MTRVGVAGYGYWGSKHARVLAAEPDTVLTIVDPRTERLREARANVPTAGVATDLDDVIDDLDALVLATPARTHSRIALHAISRGCHVLVEKPLATCVADCQELIVAAESAGVVLMVGHTFEYHGAVWKLREIAQSGELGEILYIDSARLNLGLYQPDVNVIWDLAPHDVSIVNHIVGRAPETVTTWAHRHAARSSEDVAFVRLGYADPPLTAYIHVSWLDPMKIRRVTVVGTKKMAVYNDLSTREPIRIYDSAIVPPAALDGGPMLYREGDIVSPYVSYSEPLAVEDRMFLECVRTGMRPPTDGWNGLEVVRVLEAAGQSLSVGGPIDLPSWHNLAARRIGSPALAGDDEDLAAATTATVS